MVHALVREPSADGAHELVGGIIPERNPRCLVASTEITTDRFANHRRDGRLSPLRPVTKLAKSLFLEAEIRRDVATHDAVEIPRYRDIVKA